MLALYHSGRQADALEAYGNTRKALDELGLEPGEELKRLQTGILQHDPALDRPVAPARPRARVWPRSRQALALRTTGLAVVAVLLAGAVLAFSGVGRRDSTPAAVIVPRNSVVEIDPDTNTVVAAAPIDARPSGIAVGGGAIWVGIYDDNVLLRIDPRSHRVVRAIAISGEPADVAARRTAVWVTSSVGTSTVGMVSRVDARTNFVPKTVRLRQTVPGLRFTSAEPGPRGVAIGGGSVWVAHSFSLVSRLDARSASIVKRILLTNPPEDVAYGSGGLWVTTSGEPTVARIDPISNTVDLTTLIGPELEQLGAIATGEGAIWVTSHGWDWDQPGRLWRLDSASGRVTGVIRVGRVPVGVAVGHGAVWVANYRDGTVSRIDPESQEVVATIKVRRGSAQIAVGDGVVWVTVRDPAADTHGGGPP
jgi:DNA-binding beta-propeller fold protein YncE